MQAYLQGPNGEEAELVVTEPDPADGTYCVSPMQVMQELDNLTGGDDDSEKYESFWIRIVPDDLIQPGEEVVLKLEDLG